MHSVCGALHAGRCGHGRCRWAAARCQLLSCLIYLAKVSVTPTHPKPCPDAGRDCCCCCCCRAHGMAGRMAWPAAGRSLALPGAVELVRGCRAAGLRTGVVSNADAKKVRWCGRTLSQPPMVIGQGMPPPARAMEGRGRPYCCQHGPLCIACSNECKRWQPSLGAVRLGCSATGAADQPATCQAACHATAPPGVAPTDARWLQVDASLRAAGLDPAKDFDAVVTAGDAPSQQHLKPAPGLLLLAAQRLGVSAAACVMVEDSAPGLEAARAAGTHAHMHSHGPGPHEAKPWHMLAVARSMQNAGACILSKQAAESVCALHGQCCSLFERLNAPR